MKIIFICGCLEPGKDGVGDYTRCLSAALVRQGVSVGLIAYNDQYIKNKTETLQKFEGINIPCLRLPALSESSYKCSTANDWVESKNPEWLSLQFVPYSFNDKGLVFGLGSQLKKIGGERKWHIMFHELWLGLDVDSALKETLLGSFQKILVKYLVKKLNVKIVNTHMQLYIHELHKIKVYPVYLPIFSNISLTKANNSKRYENNNSISLVMFGSVRTGAPKTEFAEEVLSFLNMNKDKNISLTLIGKSGDEQEKWAQEFKLKGIDVEVLGELSDKEISSVLQRSKFGITTVPSFLVEKSGTVAAMTEHGLPVLIVAKTWKPKNNINLKLPEGLMEYKSGNFNVFLKSNTSKVKTGGVKFVAESFLNALS